MTVLSDQMAFADHPDGPTAQETTAMPVARRKTRGRRFSVLAWLCGIWLTLIVVAALTADLLPLKDYSVPIGKPRTPPGWRPEFLGTDSIGRSTLSRVVYGARVSLAISGLAVGAGMILGTTFGVLAGYLQGWVDATFNLVINSMLAFPALVFLLAMAAMLTPSLTSLSLALAVLTIPSFARLARGATLGFSQREFVRAAAGLGARRRRIVFFELLPNVAPIVLSYAFLVVATVMVAEGSLSFLGLGIPPPQPSWGGMISAGQQYLTTHPFLIFVPSAVLLLTVLAFNVLGELLRKRFDAPQAAP